MYRTDFWTLWEKVRVGCFKRTACILSRVKQITSPGWMYEISAQPWCTGKTQKNRVERGSGWGIHVTPWLIHVNVWQNPLQCCEVISLQLIKINEKKSVKERKRQVHKNGEELLSNHIYIMHMENFKALIYNCHQICTHSYWKQTEEMAQFINLVLELPRQRAKGRWDYQLNWWDCHTV